MPGSDFDPKDESLRILRPALWAHNRLRAQLKLLTWYSVTCLILSTVSSLADSASITLVCGGLILLCGALLAKRMPRLI
jgi:hypothetical protein